MEFLYTMVMVFLPMYGLAMLIRAAADFLLGDAVRTDIYVRSQDGIGEFVRNAHNCRCIGGIYLVLNGGESDRAALLLAEKYADVHIVGGEAGEIVGEG